MAASHVILSLTQYYVCNLYNQAYFYNNTEAEMFVHKYDELANILLVRLITQALTDNIHSMQMLWSVVKVHLGHKNMAVTTECQVWFSAVCFLVTPNLQVTTGRF